MSKHKNQDTVVKGLHVEVKNNDVGRAMRRLKKLMSSEGLQKDMRAKDFYEKPSIRKKKAKDAARKRWLKQLEKNKNDY
jgi:small subunit ribosomal protein S21